LQEKDQQSITLATYRPFQNNYTTILQKKGPKTQFGPHNYLAAKSVPAKKITSKIVHGTNQ